MYSFRPRQKERIIGHQKKGVLVTKKRSIGVCLDYHVTVKHQNLDPGKSDQKTLGPANFWNFAKSYIHSTVKVTLTCNIYFRLTKYRMSDPINGLKKVWGRNFTVEPLSTGLRHA